MHSLCIHAFYNQLMSSILQAVYSRAQFFLAFSLGVYKQAAGRPESMKRFIYSFDCFWLVSLELTLERDVVTK